MGLQTDRVFYEALKASDAVATQVGDNIYNTAIPGSDEDVDNVQLPYIVVTFDGMNNDDFTKDSSFEGETDIVNIGIDIAAEDRAQLATIAECVRTAVDDYFEDYEPITDDEDNIVEDLSDEIPEDYAFSASAVQYDAFKPCFWQILNFRCDTKRL